MCGIVGYVGAKEAVPILLDGLRHLEYRGYDSAGVCVGSLKLCKSEGRLENLCTKLKLTPLSGTCGIGHTRWATHGMPTQYNAHPHLSANGTLCLVHNGIIENYQFLKERMAGTRFRSDTDSEVAASLIEHYYTGDLKAALLRACKDLRGSYAFGIVCADSPQTLWACKHKSPLVIGLAEGECFLASDISALLQYTREVVFMDDGEIVKLTPQGACFYNAAGEEIRKTPEHIDLEPSAVEKDGFPHFMLKEIFEQPQAVRQTLAEPIAALKKPQRLYIVGCGSAYYAGLHGKYLFEHCCQIPTQVVPSSEFYCADPEALVLLISQSGETADTLSALRRAGDACARTLAIVNVPGSALSKLSDAVLYTRAGPEIAVATTKAFSAQLCMLYRLACTWGGNLGAMEGLPMQIQTLLTPDRLCEIRALAAEIADKQNVYFIGRRLDSATAAEAALKLKELAYVHAEGYAAGELKHGPISLIAEGMPVLALATAPQSLDKIRANIREVKARGAYVLAVATQPIAEADRCLLVPKAEPWLQPSLNIVPLQLLAYYVALLRGCDVDKPRNLAKSVTVE